MAVWNRSRAIAVGGVVTGLVLAGGGVALASSSSDSTAATATTSASAAATPRGALRWRRIAARIEHGQFVVRGKSGTVTRDLINGAVSAVSPSSLTVRAADGTEETFAVTSQTKVRARAGGKGSPSTMAAVAVGDHVVVLGTGSSSLSANRVVDIKR